MPDIFLRPGEANPSDIVLRDPTSSGGTTAYTLTGLTGVFALAGQDAGLLVGRVLGSLTGSFALSGQLATLTYGQVLTALQGAFTEAGQNATLTVTTAGIAYVLTADPGSFALTGENAILTFTPATPAQRPAQLVGMGGRWYTYRELFREQKKKHARKPEPVERELDPAFVHRMAKLGTRPRREVTFTPLDISDIRESIQEHKTIAVKNAVRRRREREAVEV
jgi:hypothetical protein